MKSLADEAGGLKNKQGPGHPQDAWLAKASQPRKGRHGRPFLILNVVRTKARCLDSTAGWRWQALSLETSRQHQSKARDYAISLLGERLYNIFIQGYTHKQWGIPPEELPASIVKRLPLHLSWNDQYFIDKYQALPTQGYTNFILELLKGSDFIGTANYNTDKPYWNRQAKDIIYTGSLDEFYGYDLGLLPYRSMRHELGRVESGSQIYCATMNYTDYETPYTRIMEWKYFDNRPPKMRHSVYSTEYPLKHRPGETIPVWPINTPENDQLHTRYLDRIGQANWIQIGGRLGSYRYYNMDQTIGAAIDLVGKIGKAL